MQSNFTGNWGLILIGIELLADVPGELLVLRWVYLNKININIY